MGGSGSPASSCTGASFAIVRTMARWSVQDVRSINCKQPKSLAPKEQGTTAAEASDHRIQGSEELGRIVRRARSNKARETLIKRNISTRNYC